ncbi:hypothetical protein QQP08_015212 [Theobroma cacao]|nr:hypothetical protein QQP08_015212 [Theobroma cacao]
MAILLSQTLTSTMLLLVTLFALTATTESYCSDAMATSLLSGGFTRFLYTLHARNFTTATRLTYLAPPDSALMNHNLDEDSLRSHISTDGALTYQSLLSLSPNTTLSTLCNNTSLVVGTDGEKVSINDILVAVPNLYVDGSCVVHGVDGPLVPIPSSPPVDDFPKTRMTTMKSRVVPKRQTLQISVYSKFIRRGNPPNVTDKDNSQFIYFVLVIFFVSRVSIVSGRALFCIDLVMFMYYLFLMLEVETGTFLGLIVLYGIASAGEEPASLFDMCYLHPVSDLDYPPQETAYQSEHGRRSEYDCRYWLSEYDSCCGGYWGDDLFSAGEYSRNDDGCNEPVVKTEDCDQSEDQYPSYTSYCEEDLSQPDSYYNPWPCHQYCEDEDSCSCSGEEPRNTDGCRLDELGLCHGIFGYFPCLLREQQRNNNAQ